MSRTLWMSIRNATLVSGETAGRDNGPFALCSDAIGDKAFRIAQMTQLGYPTPGGCVLWRSALDCFLQFNQLELPIKSILDRHASNDIDQLNAASQSISALIRNGEFPTELIVAIESILRELPNELLVVRSSAVGEDSHTAAFAGQLDSLLHVQPTLLTLLDAIRACWASYWSSRVLFYQRTRGVSLQGMAVLIQPQINATYSGILFTRSPTEVGSQTMMIEYCAGLGDGLAAGHVTPARVSLDRKTLRTQDTHQHGNSLLDDKYLIELATIGLKLEDYFQTPQDIEWSLDHCGQLVLLQSRPITTLSHASQASTLKYPVVWSNVNVNENYPDPVCPLLFSIAQRAYYHYFRNLGVAFGIADWRIAKMERALQQIVGAQGGRLYYNLSNIHDVLRSAPFDEALIASFNLFVGADRDASSQAEDGSWQGNRRGKIRQTCELIWIGLCTSWNLLWMASRVIRFENRTDQFALDCRAALATQCAEPARRDRLLSQFREFLEIRCHGWLEASMADAAAMISYSAWQRFVRFHFSEDQDSSLHNSLLKGLCDVVSGKPALELWEISRRIRSDQQLKNLFASSTDHEVLAAVQSEPRFAGFQSDLQVYLATWGFRCSGELMLTVPSLQEQPELLVSMLRTYAAQDGPPPRLQLDQQQQQRKEATGRLVSQLRTQKIVKWLPWPNKATLALFLLRWTQQAISCRERARLKQAMLYQCLRRICLALGELQVQKGSLDANDDLLYLNCEEIEAYFSGGALFPREFCELIHSRRKQLQQFSKVRPPDTFSLAVGEAWTADNSEHTHDSNAQVVASQSNTWSGQGVCGGVVKGTSKVLRDVSEAAKLSAGDILVTRQTDPGWGPVFLLIRGLVMERGGMLSHGAIMAREYGLPTVVGVPHVTTTISTGQSLLVDGDRGIVQRI
jgi:rifampicin phosphotransferase